MLGPRLGTSYKYTHLCRPVGVCTHKDQLTVFLEFADILLFISDCCTLMSVHPLLQSEPSSSRLMTTCVATGESDRVECTSIENEQENFNDAFEST